MEILNGGPGIEAGRKFTEIPTTSLEIIEINGMDEVETKLREVTLLSNPIPGFRPYHPSIISLKEVPLELLKPSALYVLRKNLEIQKTLREALLIHGIDTLHLTHDRALIRYKWGEFEGVFSPPLVEISEDDEENPYVITDGLHRATLARELGESTIASVVVGNMAAPLPVLPVEWHEVETVDTVPSRDEKRRFRFNSDEEILSWFNGPNTQRNRERYLSGFPNLFDKLGAAHIFDRRLVPHSFRVGPDLTENEVNTQYNSVGIIISNKNLDRVFLCEHVGTPGKWSNIGGSRKVDESTPMQTLQRELREELGIFPAYTQPSRPLVVIDNHLKDDKTLGVVYLVTIDEESFKAKPEPYQISRFCWFSRGGVEGLLKNPTSNIRPRGYFYTLLALAKWLETDENNPTNFGGVIEVS